MSNINELLVLFADNLCKQFGPRSGLTKCPTLNPNCLTDTLMVFLKELYKEVDFEKKAADDTMLITFANNFDKDQARQLQNIWPYLYLNCFNKKACKITQ